MVISILCGGSGTRLFPLSRELLPKQFAFILPAKNIESNPDSHTLSLFQETLLRNQFLSQTHNTTFQVITNDNHYFIAQDQALSCGVDISEYLLETSAKNTAPAICLAALSVQEKYQNGIIKDDIMLALPSDHLIKNLHLYEKAIKQAINLAKKGLIVTFGVQPTSPHTGYGYIQTSGEKVLQFIEKPSLEKATQYLKEGGYLWNSGMFCFSASVLLEEMRIYANAVYEACEVVFKNLQKDTLFSRFSPSLSEKIPEISIDYALMEHSKKVACVGCDFVWSDVGSFESLSEEYEQDSNKNASKNAFVSKDCTNNFIFSNKLVAGVGIKDLMIIDERDCLLVAKKGHSQQVKDIVAMLKRTAPELTRVHTTAHRPWGSYTVLLESQYYKIKQIIVKPQKRLSLQKHFHRNEHWIVVSGSCVVRIGEKESFLKANQSTYIPMGEIHRLENHGKLPLVLIEVQMGEYLGEDDIVRLDDDYKRV